MGRRSALDWSALSGRGIRRSVMALLLVASPAQAWAEPFWSGACSDMDGVRQEAARTLRGSWMAIASDGAGSPCWTNELRVWHLDSDGPGGSLTGEARVLLQQAKPVSCANDRVGTVALSIRSDQTKTADPSAACALSLEAALANHDPRKEGAAEKVRVDWNWFWGGSPILSVHLRGRQLPVDYEPVTADISPEGARRIGLVGPRPELGAHVYSGSTSTFSFLDRPRHVYRFRGFAGEKVAWEVRGTRVPLFPRIRSSVEAQALPIANPVSRMEGPNGFSAEGAKEGDAFVVRATLPADGEYRVIVTVGDPPNMGTYSIGMTSKGAAPPAPGDCSRFRLSEFNRSNPISSDEVRPGGTTRLRPLWSFRDDTYDVPPSCLTNWKVSDPAIATLSEDRTEIRISPGAKPGRIQVTAEVAGRPYMGYINIQ